MAPSTGLIELIESTGWPADDERQCSDSAAKTSFLGGRYGERSGGRLWLSLVGTAVLHNSEGGGRLCAAPTVCSRYQLHPLVLPQPSQT